MAKAGSDKSPLWKGNRKPHDYTVLYDELFGSWRSAIKFVRVLECGIFDGASLRAWDTYFQPFCQVYGLDISIERLEVGAGIFTFQCDQTDREAVARVLKGAEPLNLIIDDGLHNPTGAIPFFTEAFPYLAKDGYYIVEDVKPKYLNETVAGMKAAHPQARITVHDRRYPGSKYDNILIVATHS